MPTVKLVASSYSVTGSVTVTNPDRMYTDVSSTTYATLTHTTSGTTSYYCYIKGFNFSAVPDNANVSSITIRIRGYETGLSTSTSYAPRLYNNTSTITGASAASANFGTSASTITVPYTGTWATLKGYGADLGIRVTIRRSSRNTQGYLYIYGAEIEVTYTVPADIHVTGVSLDKQTDSIEVGESTTLTETVSPSNATDKTVSWSTSSSSVATVSGGVVTGVSAGTARITVTTNDGGYTAYCDVTVTPATLYDFVPATTLEPGKQYLITNGNSGSVYLLTNESAGSGALAGVAAAVSNGKISITGAAKAKALFACVLQDNNNQGSTVLMSGSDYLYTDSSSRLRIAAYTSSMDGKHWHYKADGKNLLWFFKDGTDNDGYTDTSSTYKYYLSCTSGTWADLYVSTTSLADTTTPAVYLWEAAIPATGVSLDKSTDTVAVGSTTTLTATVSPSNATNKAVSWSTSDASVATVSDGVVTGVAAGTAIITVTTTDGGYTDNCTVTVTGGGGGTWTTIFDDDVQIIPDSPYNYIYYSGFSGAFEADTTYRITWDGVAYTCQSQPNASTYDGYSVGNLALGAGGTDTGEPFLIYRASWDSTVLTADTTSDPGEYGRWIHCKIEKLSGGNPPPVITVGTPSQTAISAVTGHDQCVCTFTSDLALQQWEARATKAGTTPARGVGLLVESGTTLAANTPATIYVENEELTQGDGEYTITVYGQSTDGVWSE